MRRVISLRNKIQGAALTAASLVCLLTGAQAQNPTGPLPATPFTLPFDNLDWLTAQGQNTYFGPGVNTNTVSTGGVPNGANATGQRPGYTDYKPNYGTSPGPATFRWTFPFNYQLPIYTGATQLQVPVTVDNPNIDPKYNGKIYTDPGSFFNKAHSYLPPSSTGQVWVIPTGAFVAGIGGYSLPGVDAAAGYYGDYAYTKAIHNDFTVTRAGGTGPATDSELAALPNASPEVYTAVNSALINTAQPVAVWTSGPLTQGRYSIRLYSPGAGTTASGLNEPPVIWPNVSRAFVRVSWGPNTTPGANGELDPTSLFNAGSALNDPVTSRIFEVNLQSSGWVPLVGGGFSASATFPYDGNINDQLVVTLYTLTPDNLTASVFNGNPPTVTADAVQFTLQQTTSGTTVVNGVTIPAVTADAGLVLKDLMGNPLPLRDASGNVLKDANGVTLLNTISPVGRLLGSPVGTGKLTNFYKNGVPILLQPSHPLMYFAREEYIADTINRSYVDPTKGGTLVPDPTSPGGTVPVFYCIDNKNQNQISAYNATKQITSAEKVIWRYVADSDNGTGTSYASPVLANVRCRDGIVRSMVYFTTTSGSGRSHVYALDPVGDLATHTTHAYWEYPSATTRGLANDRNIEGVTPTVNYLALESAYTANVPDQPFAGNLNIADPTKPILLFDEYISPYTGALDTKRQIPFAGVKGAPLLMDDPTNPTGPQMLVIASLDGHIYSFDAGGRGDFGTVANVGYVSGTTQRLWTWPRLAADREYFLYTLKGASLPVSSQKDPPILVAGDSPLPNQNIIEQFSTSPTLYNAANTNSPIVIGSDNGHLYTLYAGHESFDLVPKTGTKAATLTTDARLQWTFPSEAAGKNPKTPLGAVSTVTVYQPGGNLRDQYVFTAGGRVYSVYANTANATFATQGELAWAYPNPTTLNNGNPALYDPAVADPNDSNTTPFDLDFNAAPLVLKGINFYPEAVGASLGAASTHDLCYALLSNGALYALDAQPQDAAKHTTTLYATNSASNGILPLGNTEASPIAVRITPEPTFYNVTNTDTSPIAIVYGDLDGNIFGFKAIPELPPTAIDAGSTDTNYLPVIWEHRNAENRLPAAARSAAAAVIGGDTYNSAANLGAHGLLLSGDENGVLYCYSFGDGADGRTPTIPKDQINPDIGRGDVSIDIRGVNIFSQSNFAAFDQTGGIANTLTPLNTSALRGNTDQSLMGVTDPRAFEWGDSVYIVAWGVYHAVPTNALDPNLFDFGDAPPVVTVSFRVKTGGGRSASLQPSVQLPGTIANIGTNSYGVVGNSNPAVKWPGDVVAFNNGTDYSIYGIDASDPAAFMIDPVTHQRAEPKATNLYRNKNGGVIPWVAVYKTNGRLLDALQIIPDKAGSHPYTPGTTGLGITVLANITQSLRHHGTDPMTLKPDVTLPTSGPDMAQGTPTNAFNVGTLDPDGRGFEAGKPAGPTQDPKPLNGRTLYVAHPLAVTTRGKNSSNVLTKENYNVMGFSASLAEMSLVHKAGETLANGNRVVNTVNNTTTLKSLFAPLGAIENNTSGKYLGLDNTGLVPALYAADRSNYTRATGMRLPMEATMTPLGWHGGPTSVMNPLPWEQIPLEGIGSPDYPNLGAERIKLTKATGEDLLTYSSSNPPTLTPPSNNKKDADGYVHGDINPTELSLSVNVPKYFPANMNFGTAKGIGAAYKDPASGIIFGDPTLPAVANNPTYPNIIGPLYTASGLMASPGDGYDNPSGGFIGTLNIAIAGGGQLPDINARQTYLLATSSSIRYPFRAVTVGASVLPTLKMRIDEQTIDLGKLSHGGGYSDPVTSPALPGGLRAPFNPNFVNSAYYNSLNSQLKAFYDRQNSMYFRPFTLYNESNVNLVDVRIAKLTSIDGNQKIGIPSLSSERVKNFAQAIQIQSSGINDYGLNPLFGIGFNGAGGGVGNIGVVTSLDHASDNNNIYSAPAYREDASWFPLLNPFVDQNNVNDWNAIISSLANPAIFPNSQLMPLPVNNAAKAASSGNIYTWLDGKQPQPTIHKPRPGDGVGTIMTLPDAPYGRATADSHPPMLGIAIPLGAPVGTYSVRLNAFEDNTPVQMRLWEDYRGSGGYLKNVTDHDGILNQISSGNNTDVNLEGEAQTNPGTTLRFTVMESRLTNGASKGSLGAIDPINDPLLSLYPGSKNQKPAALSLGSDLLPAALPIAGNNSYTIALYNTTNRQPMGSKFVDGNTYTPIAGAPWYLSYSALSLPYTSGSNNVNFYDAAFARNGVGNYDISGQWWTQPTLFGGTEPALTNRFPSAPGQVAGVPSLFGDPVPQTERHGSPAITSDNGVTPYLFWQGSVDKIPTTNAAQLASNPTQIRDSRTFYQALDKFGAPTGNTFSFLNDPALTKLSPRPLLVTLSDKTTKVLFLFWHTGGRGQTALYYNVNRTPGFPANGWSRDTKLPVPAGVTWQSDPTVLYRQIFLRDPVTDAVVPGKISQDKTTDCLDVLYTGVLKNRSNAETLMSRYEIVADADTEAITLQVKTLPVVTLEQLARVGQNTYEARDASWYSDPKTGTILLAYSRNGGAFKNLLVNAIGRFDAGSGLTYYDSTLGGQVAVDARTGRVSFPNVTLNRATDVLYASYVPQVMRVSVNRTDTRPVLDASGAVTTIPSPVNTTSANTYSPVAFLDTKSPARTNGGRIDRMWVFYRKSDPTSGSSGSSLYYKTMRLMVKIPNYTPGNAITVTGATASETDTKRGIAFFTQDAEGAPVTVNGYASRVAWRDELGSMIQDVNTKRLFWSSIPDTILPTDSQINEGQVSAFKDPFQDKVWVFWTSARNGMSDLYYETISPQFYPFK